MSRLSRRNGGIACKRPRAPGRVRQFCSRYMEDYLFVAPYTLLFFIFTVIPVGASLLLSLTNWNVLETPAFVGLKNYFKLFLEDPIFVLALKNTLLLSLITGPVSFFLSLFVAWLVNEFNPKLRTLLTLLFYAPSLSGGVYMVWQIILSNDSNGLLNALLMDMNIIYEPILWTTNPKYMFAACIAVVLWMSLGTSFLSFIAGFQNVDRTLYEAGAVDGLKNRWQELWYITLPSMRPQLMFGALHTLVHHLQDYGNIRFEMGYASAIATILFLIMLVTNQLVQRLLAKLG